MFFQGIARVAGRCPNCWDDGEPPGSRSRAVRVVRISWRAACSVRETDEIHDSPPDRCRQRRADLRLTIETSGGADLGSTLRILFVIVATITGVVGRFEGQPASSGRFAAAETAMAWLEDTAVRVPVDPDPEELATVLVGLRRPASMQGFGSASSGPAQRSAERRRQPQGHRPRHEGDEGDG